MESETDYLIHAIDKCRIAIETTLRLQYHALKDIAESLAILSQEKT